MAIRSKHIVPLSQAEAFVEELRGGQEKILTRNGETYVALIDARRLDPDHRLESDRLHLELLDEAERGLDDVDAGRTVSVAELRAKHGR